MPTCLACSSFRKTKKLSHSLSPTSLAHMHASFNHVISHRGASFLSFSCPHTKKISHLVHSLNSLMNVHLSLIRDKISTHHVRAHNISSQNSPLPSWIYSRNRFSPRFIDKAPTKSIQQVIQVWEEKIKSKMRQQHKHSHKRNNKDTRHLQVEVPAARGHKNMTVDHRQTIPPAT